MKCESLRKSHDTWKKFRLVPFQRKMPEHTGMLVKVVTHEDVSFSLGAFFYGIVVSKKLGNAVCRNRMKRRVREACRLVSLAIVRSVPPEKRRSQVTSCFVLLKEKALINFPFSSIVEQLFFHLSTFFPYILKNSSP